MTSAECCAYLGISKSHLFKLTHDRAIPHYKPGKLLYFMREEIDEWIKRSPVATKEELEAKAIEYCIKNKTI